MTGSRRTQPPCPRRSRRPRPRSQATQRRHEAMFGKLGQIASLLGNMPRIQEEMQKFQQNLGQIIAEGDAGAGVVKVRVNGRMEILSCQLLESTMTGGDRELLEDLIKAATN